MPSLIRLIGSGIFAAVLCQSTLAQEELQDVFEAPVTGVFVASASVDEAQWDVTPFDFADNPMALIGWPQISDELEIVDEQRQMIHELQKEMQEQMQRTMESVMKRQKEGQPIDHDQVAKRIQQLNQDLRDRLHKDVLLPHQGDRLKQLALQMQMRHRGGGALMSERFVEELGITEGQKDRLKQAAKEAQEHLRAEMERLRKEAREKVMGELTDSQREKLKEMLGNPIDLSRPRLRPGAGR